jgi:zinc transporter ZupT
MGKIRDSEAYQSLSLKSKGLYYSAMAGIGGAAISFATVLTGVYESSPHTKAHEVSDKLLVDGSIGFGASIALTATCLVAYIHSSSKDWEQSGMFEPDTKQTPED